MLKTYKTILLLSLFITPGICLPFEPDAVSFIVQYIHHSELQVPFYTVVVCGGQEHRLLLALSRGFKKLYLFRDHGNKNLSDWRVSNDAQGFILDMECPHSLMILQQASDLNLFRKPYSWLLISGHSSSTEVSVVGEDADIFGLNKLNVRLDSLVAIARALENSTFEMSEIYKITENSDTIIKDLGRWTNIEGITFKSTESLAWRRRDLNGITLTATLIISKPDTREHLSDLINVHHDSPTKLAYGVLQTVSQTLNVKFDYIDTATWGVLVNGTWNGMVGQLAHREADVGASALFISRERLEEVDYFHGMYIYVGFIARAPPLSYSSNLFALPFSSSVWISSVLLLVLASILLFITLKIENESLKLVVPDKETLGPNLSDIGMLNFGIISQQGYDLEPRGLAARIVTASLYFSVMFLYISYSASIVALLQSSDTSISTIKDLLDSPLQCGAEDIAYQRAWLKSASDPVRQEFYKKKIIPKGEEKANFLKIEDGIEQVRKGLYAFHVDLSAGYIVVQNTFTEAEKCGLQELRVFLQVPEPWIPIRKYSPYFEAFKISAKRGSEMGVESRSTRRYTLRKPRCTAYGSNFASVGFMDSYRLFLILLYGACTSVFLLLIEILFKISKSRQELKSKILFEKRKLGDRIQPNKKVK